MLNYISEQLNQIIKKYDDIDEYADEEEEDEKETTKNISQFSLQPSIADPKMWFVKCRMGTERECVQTLFHKFFAFKGKDTKELK